MKKRFLLLYILAIVSCKKAQEPQIIDDASITTTTAVSSLEKILETDKEFPNDYLGIYKGKLNITSSTGVQTIPMEFHLLSTEDVMNYEYKIYYGEERAERAYNLKKTHNPHLYLVDENNGIILETAYADKTLFSTYEVMGNLLNCTEVFHDEYMEFMITMARVQDTSITGNVESAIVKNYPLSVMQKAVLYKE